MLDEILSKANLIQAWKKVKANGGVAGVDGVAIEEFQEYVWKHWTRIKQEIMDESYQPSPVKRVEIPKPNGRGKRKLGIPTIPDRVICQAILQVLQPIFDPQFSDSSHGFRPRRSCHGAVKQARRIIDSGYGYVLDMDLEKFFDTVNHDILMQRLARRVKDKRVQDDSCAQECRWKERSCQPPRVFLRAIYAKLRISCLEGFLSG